MHFVLPVMLPLICCWVQCIWRNPEWKCRIENNIFPSLYFYVNPLTLKKQLWFRTKDLNEHTLLSCCIMLIIWTSFSFQGNELNARGVKLCELHRRLSNCGKIAHFNSTLLLAVGFLVSLLLLALCLQFIGLPWWSWMPQTVQVLFTYSWHQYYDLSTWWLWNQSIRHSMNWLKIQS